jgi:hypothetical protein
MPTQSRKALNAPRRVEHDRIPVRTAADAADKYPAASTRTTGFM